MLSACLSHTQYSSSGIKVPHQGKEQHEFYLLPFKPIYSKFLLGFWSSKKDTLVVLRLMRNSQATTQGLVDMQGLWVMEGPLTLSLPVLNLIGCLCSGRRDGTGS